MYIKLNVMIIHFQSKMNETNDNIFQAKLNLFNSNTFSSIECIVMHLYFYIYIQLSYK